MKRFLYHLLLFVGIAHLTACSEPDTPIVPENPQHENHEFVFENIVARHTQLRVDISPVDKDMEYVVFLAEKKHFVMNGIDTREELLEDDYAYILGLANQYNMTLRDFLKAVGWLINGEAKEYGAVSLYPDTEYVVYCYGISIDGELYEATTPVNYAVVKTTAPEMIDVKFDVKTAIDGNRVSIKVDPNGYDKLYYSYIVPDTDRYFIHEGMEFTDDYIAYYRNRAFNEFNPLINDQGIAPDQFCYRGKATIEERLDPNTNYQIVLFAVSDEQLPLLCSVPVAHNFSTEGVDLSDLTIDIKVTDITPYTAQLTVTPSNNNEQYACVFLARNQIPPYEDEYEQMMALITDYIPAVFRGSWSEQLMPLMPNSEYTVLAFGVENDLPTTKLFRYDFTSAEAQEGAITIESIDLVKLFDAQEIIALDPSYSDAFAECECVAVVEVKTSKPTDKVYFWWYEEWMKIEYSDEAFLEDLLLYDYSPNPCLMDMYYSMSEDDKFFFAGIAEDDEGNMSPIYFGETFTLNKEQCSPASEFFDLL